MFILENGELFVLVQVGGVVIVFGSVYGNDQLVLGFDVGEFFFIDDGFFFGLEMILVIVIFVNFIDSFVICVLDIDLGEFFIMEVCD